MEMEKRPLIGISSCLLGNCVRYDKQHKLHHYIKDTLGMYVDFVPLCPEVECGFGTPRESMRIVRVGEEHRLLTVRSKQDVTEQLTQWIPSKLEKLAEKELCGFIFKAKSPSCGMGGVKIYTEKGMPNGSTSGFFAKAMMEQFPHIPFEDEGRLNDAKLRENFIERLFVKHRWNILEKEHKTVGKLVEFHSQHKYLIMSHSPKTVSFLGKLLAQSNLYSIEELFDIYIDELMKGLKLVATIKKNTNVLLHIMGYFKKDLTTSEKEELKTIIEQYHNGLIPSIVPITLLNHYVRKYEQPYLKEQFYLNPHPMELMLRNHV